MLVMEQLAIPNSHHFHLEAPSLPSSTPYKPIPTEVDVEFDAELEDLENRPTSSLNGSGINGVAIPNTPISLEIGTAQSGRQKAFALTIGLVIHSLADGLALGVSALAKSEVGHIASSVSVVVFLALLLHKGACVPRSPLIHVPFMNRRTFEGGFSLGSTCYISYVSHDTTSYLALRSFGV